MMEEPKTLSKGSESIEDIKGNFYQRVSYLMILIYPCLPLIISASYCCNIAIDNFQSWSVEF